MHEADLTPQAVILDFDGVVIDSLAAHMAAWRAATRQIFQQDLGSDNELASLSTRAIASIIATRFGHPALAPALTKAKWHYVDTATDPMPLLPGVAEFLVAARELNLPLGIASNSSHSFIANTVARHGLSVDVIVGADDVVRAKPNPDIYWECANRLGVHPRERPRTLIFEDSLHGIRGARASGMYVIGVASGHSENELQAGGAFVTCLHLADALARGFLQIVPAST